ncbi:hypothetical protein DL1_14635 [Thioclava dalianensis]|uniref:Excinuclease ABC subunit A n=1 Tax=Thioclava dalianensis TaxID=1185766 RepID=A0A074TGF7_9RHOB|nr:hypothetical protein [Thioclava dalianensis]KEP68143.1 hypothetical protein DL1_14635 [Thioclava dalianensis]SFN39862.1 regulator RcnB of Ni and Co efflux [Thioclava dalianensis]
MFRIPRPLLCAVVGAALLPGAALAHEHGHGHDKWDHGPHHAHAGCPPGLAKTHNGCRPPGHARDDRRYDRDHRDYRYSARDDRDHHHHWRPGERIERDYVVIRDPRHYGLDPRYHYYRSDGYIYRVNQQNGEVLALIGLAQALLGN